jgi:hypothetical protein
MGIFKKKSRVDLSDPDYENSQAAIEETAEIFSQMMKRLHPNWCLYGNSELTHWIKRKKVWLPEPEFAIAQQIKDGVWEIFSRALLNQRVPGRYAEAKMQEIFDEVSDYISGVQVGFPSTRVQDEQFAECLTHGMFFVLNSDKQYLAQTYIFRLSAVWVHSRIADIQ